MAERVETADAEADGDPGRRHRRVDGTEAPAEQPVERGVRITVGRQPRHALHDPGRLAEPVQVLAHVGERLHDVEVVDAHQLAAPGVEEDELPEREELEGAPEARPHPPRRLGDSTKLPVLAREEGHHSIALAEREAADDERRRLAERHVRRSA